MFPSSSFRAEDVQPCIDPVAVILRAGILLGQPLGHPLLAVRHDEAAVIRVAVRVGEQGGQPAMNLVERRKALQIHIEHHVSVQQQKIFVQPVPDAEQRARIPQRLFLHKILDVDAEGPARLRRASAAVAEVLHDGRGQMPHCDKHIRHALLLQGSQLPLQHRTPVNGQHRQEIPCQRGDAGAAASGHDNSFHNAGSSSGA